MPLSTNFFHYDLPPERIAQHSVEPRDHSRLMILDRETGATQHKRFYEIVDELRAGDLLVMNDTKVFRARLETVDGVEVFLLRVSVGRTWQTLMQPSRKIHVGDNIVMKTTVDKTVRSDTNVNILFGRVLEKRGDGVVLVDFDREPEAVVNFANAHGEIPVPPYVNERLDDIDKYQTVYARETGSVAAPTAGFHFTSTLIKTLKEKGIEFAFVTLHVGIGTFRPMKSETIEEHDMHAEFVSISASTAEAIVVAKQEGRRVIAVGTTTVRTLEGVAASGGIRPFSGDVNLFIKPGFDFCVIDGLITNFHLPKSTLLVLVSAFAGREHVLDAYQAAIENDYRFFSFGDVMFIR